MGQNNEIYPPQTSIYIEGGMNMGFIYKITNNINNKIYIGKTYKTIEERFQEHIRDSKKENNEKRPLYAAMKKYGLKNFSIEQIEECSNSLLSAKEIYWIGYFDSYKNGYNATLGGDGSFIYDHEQILQRLKENIPTKIICEEFGCSADIVRDIARYNNIDLVALANNRKKCAINQYDLNNNFIQAFQGIGEAAEWCLKNNLSKGQNETVRKKISGCLTHPDTRKTAYGFIWKRHND